MNMYCLQQSDCSYLMPFFCETDEEAFNLFQSAFIYTNADNCGRSMGNYALHRLGSWDVDSANFNTTSRETLVNFFEEA
nr:MAG: hypothetical protein [Microvirus sp.]